MSEICPRISLINFNIAHQSEGGSLTGYVVPARVTLLASATPRNSSVAVAVAVVVAVAVAVALGPKFANQ